MEIPQFNFEKREKYHSSYHPPTTNGQPWTSQFSKYSFDIVIFRFILWNLAVRQQAIGAMSFGAHLLEELFIAGIALYGERLPSIKSECLCSYQWIPIDIFVQQVPRLGFTKGSIPGTARQQPWAAYKSQVHQWWTQSSHTLTIEAQMAPSKWYRLLAPDTCIINARYSIVEYGTLWNICQ